MINCPNCGKGILNNSKFCPFCGGTVPQDPEETITSMQSYSQAAQTSQQYDQPGNSNGYDTYRNGQPGNANGYGPYNYGQPGNGYGYNQVPYGAADKINGLALAGFIVSLCALVINLAGITALVGLILSIVGYSQINHGKGRGKGFAIAGIILGIIGIVWGILMILFVVGSTAAVFASFPMYY